jgi:hypothetical protein
MTHEEITALSHYGHGRGISAHVAAVWHAVRHAGLTVLMHFRANALDTLLIKTGQIFARRTCINYHKGGPSKRASYTVAWICNEAEYDALINSLPFDTSHRRTIRNNRVLIPSQRAVYAFTDKWTFRAVVKRAGVWIYPTSHINVHGFDVFEQWDNGYLVTFGAWNYHSRTDNPRNAVHDAIRAQQKQRFVDADNRRYHASRVWVTREASLAAGNCAQITDSFAAHAYRHIGASGPCAVRADIVLALRDDSYTRRAALVAAQKGN